MARLPTASQSNLPVVNFLTPPGDSPAAPTTEHRRKLYRALTALADYCISGDDSQTAAEILAFLLFQKDLDEAAFDRADERFADLAGRICPRVIYDAREFAAEMDLATMIEYLREISPPGQN